MKTSWNFFIFLIFGSLVFLDLSSAAYSDLNPDEQAQAEKNYERFQSLKSEKKELINDNWQRYQALPSAEKENIQSRYGKWNQLNPTQKSGLLKTAKSRAVVSAERRLDKRQDKVTTSQLRREARTQRRKSRANRCASGNCETAPTVPH